jgi:hypothetical protein
VLFGKLDNIAKPAIHTTAGMTLNAQRCLIRSEAKARIIANPKAHAQGGTECSCVLIGPYPKLWMMEGAK